MNLFSRLIERILEFLPRNYEVLNNYVNKLQFREEKLLCTRKSLKSSLKINHMLVKTNKSEAKV